MTFEEFRATRKFCPDLRTTIHADFYEDCVKAPIGLLYQDDFYIEIADGSFFLTIGCEQKTSDDLEALERDLFDYAIGEGAFQ